MAPHKYISCRQTRGKFQLWTFQNKTSYRTTFARSPTISLESSFRIQSTSSTTVRYSAGSDIDCCGSGNARRDRYRAITSRANVSTSASTSRTIASAHTYHTSSPSSLHHPASSVAPYAAPNSSIDVKGKHRKISLRTSAGTKWRLPRRNRCIGVELN